MFSKLPALRAITLCLAALVGCDQTETFAPIGERRFDVVGGEPSEYGSADDAVLLLRTFVDEQELVCSASLVAKNLALTARHCVSHLVPGRFSCTVKGVLVETDEGAGRLGVHLPADTLEFHTGSAENRELVARGARVLSTLSETICLNDIAFVVLDRELDLPILPLRMGRRAQIGEPVSLLGYGLDESMTSALGVPSSVLERNIRRDLTIFDVGPKTVEEVTVAPPRTVLLEGPSGCLGDSGGPLLANRTRAVLGVYSVLGGSSCLESRVRHWFVHVPDFEALMREAFDAVGAEPLLEVEPTASGGAGGAGSAGEAGGGGEPTSTGDAGESGAGGKPASMGDAGESGEGGESSGGSDTTEPKRRRQSGCAFTAAPASNSMGASLLSALMFVALATRRRGHA